jgi:hypothetical protein
MTCNTTHHACDCVLKRMQKLEAVLEAAKVLYDHTNRDYDEWREPLYQTLKELES